MLFLNVIIRIDEIYNKIYSFEYPRKVLESKISFMEYKKNEELDLVEEGLSLKKIKKCILEREEFMAYATTMDFSKKNVIKSIIACFS